MERGPGAGGACTSERARGASRDTREPVLAGWLAGLRGRSAYSRGAPKDRSSSGSASLHAACGAGDAEGWADEVGRGGGGGMRSEGARK